jgi:cytochrome P450
MRLENEGGVVAPEMELHLSDLSAPSDPYVLYAELRTKARLHRIRLPDGRMAWLVTRYEDIASILLDHDRFSNRAMVSQTGNLPTLSPKAAEVMSLFGLIMSSSDPPDHTRLRGLVEKAFARPLIADLRLYIQALSDELLDAVETRARVTGQRTLDLVADYAFPLPAAVIMQFLGVPPEDRDNIRRWSELLMKFDRSPQSAEDLGPEISEFISYVKTLLDRKRNPGNDLLSNLAHGSEDGRLTDLELVSLTFQLIFAGHSTTSHLIGNGILALLTHPAQLQKLRTEPVLIGSAIEELLRYDSPQQMRARLATVDVEVGEVRIGKGEVVLLLLAGGNRDPQRFDAPDDLDITRRDNRHLSFGLGIHGCFGIPLARLEGEIAIMTVLRRMPGLSLAVPAEQLKWAPSGLHQRGPAALPLTF